MASEQALDFTNVKEGGVFNKKRQPAGDYLATITKVEDTKSKEKEGRKQRPMWLWTIKVGSGVYPLYTGFNENELWKIRNLHVAAGIAVPKKRVKVNPNKLVGKQIGVTLEDDEYDGKDQSTVSATFPTSELNGTKTPGEVEDADEDEEEEVEGPAAADVADEDEMDALDVEEL